MELLMSTLNSSSEFRGTFVVHRVIFFDVFALISDISAIRRNTVRVHK